jgi:hypothetical protein
MADSYEEALETGEVYGRPQEDIGYVEYLRDVILGNRQFEAVPPSITVEGRTFGVTPETARRGLLNLYFTEGDAEDGIEAAAERFELQYSRFGCCALSEGILSDAVNKQAVPCEAITFVGLYTDYRNRIVAAAGCPRSISDSQAPIIYPHGGGPRRYFGGLDFYPALLEAGMPLDMLTRATPHKPKQYETLVKDLLRNFVGAKKITSYWADGMNDGYEDTEERDYRADALLEEIAKLDQNNREKLGDDYSVNASVKEISQKIESGKLTLYNDTEIGAQQLAAVWLHLQAARMLALRTRVFR